VFSFLNLLNLAWIEHKIRLTFARIKFTNLF